MNLRYVVVSKAIYSYTPRLHFQGFKGLQRWIHNSLSFEDDFSDLGPPVMQGVNTRLKLATEKREFFIQSKDDSRNSTVSSNPDMKMIPNAKDLLMFLDKSSRTHAKTEISENTRAETEKPQNACLRTEKPENAHSQIKKPKDTRPKTEKPKDTRPKIDKCDSNIKNSTSISIENVPSAVDMSKLLESLSTFGKISSASMENVASGLDRCVVKFENEESSLRAISAGIIRAGSFNLPICPLHSPKSVTIRIKDISKDTAYTSVHSICKTIGELVGMVKVTENSMDVLFRLKEYSETQNILAELNKKIVDDCKWSACLLADPSSPEVMSKNELSQLGLQVSDRLTELQDEFSTLKVYAEDLKYMHLAIMHLEEHHTVDSGSTIS